MTNQDPSRVVTDFQMAKLAQAIEHFRTLDKEIPAQVIATFLYVASHDDCFKGDLEKALAFSTASGSRNSDWLSEFHRLNKAGLGLITKYRDPTNRRRQILKLSPKGRILVQQLKTILYGSSDLG
tara:strand:+ start:1557 stop:1931 length:375 start_codon:yes stop_codon:yes gene_type:complete